MSQPATDDAASAAEPAAEPRAGAAADAVRARPVRRRLHEAPTVAVVGLLALGLVGVSLGHWRVGAVTIGVAPLLAAFFRLVLPAREAGLLAIRGRTFDVVLLAGLGSAVVALAWVVPVYYHVR